MIYVLLKVTPLDIRLVKYKGDRCIHSLHNQVTMTRDFCAMGWLLLATHSPKRSQNSMLTLSYM